MRKEGKESLANCDGCAVYRTRPFWKFVTGTHAERPRRALKEDEFELASDRMAEQEEIGNELRSQLLWNVLALKRVALNNVRDDQLECEECKNLHERE